MHVAAVVAGQDEKVIGIRVVIEDQPTVVPRPRLSISEQPGMTEPLASRDDDDPPRIAPTLQLSRRGLILSLVAMVAMGLGVYAMFPESVGGPPLPVDVRLERQSVPTTGGGAVLTEVVVVRNQANHEIARLSLEINGQYLLFRDSPLQQGESLVLPQRIFTDKRSSQRFNPSKYDVEDVTVSGQLPSGARGMSKFEYVDEQLVDVK